MLFCENFESTTKVLYPYLKYPAKPISSDLRQDVKKKIKGGFCAHVGYVVATGTDSLVISHFLGLSILGIYSNYLLIIGIARQLSNMVINAVRASACNLVVSASVEDNYSFFLQIEFSYHNYDGFFWNLSHYII